MRYGAALLVASAVIAAIAIFIWATNRQFETQVRDTLRQRQQEGTLPPELQGADIATVDFRDLGIKVPASQLSRLELARLLANRWYVWAPTIVLVCMGIAALMGRTARQSV